MQRSPPNKSYKTSSNPIMDQAQSVPNIVQAVNDPDFVNISSRHKRPRLDESSSDQLQEFKQEIKEMLTSWKSEQDQSIAKVMADQTALITKLVSGMAELKLQNSQIQHTNAEIGKSVSSISELYDGMKCEMKRLHDQCNVYRKQAESLEKTVRDLQFKSRSSCVEVRNIPSNDGKESIADLTKIVTTLGTTVDLPISATSIRDIYRLPGKSASSKPIVAEFTSVHLKTELLARLRGFNNKQPNKESKLNTELLGLAGRKRAVYVDEHLPSSTRKLFYLAREYAKKQEFNFCWVTNGNIFLRKQPGDQHILVKSEATLQELQTKT